MHRLLVRSFCTATNIAKKESVVVIGTGWAGYKFLQDISADKYDITIISPRNHFVFTPLLASTSVGTLEFRSISEPIRMLGKKEEYYEAFAKDIDTEKKTVFCESALNNNTFNVPYDKLIIASGAVSNTFNTPGVYEHAFFLKELADARKIRQRIIDCFEIASEPGLSLEDKKAVLHFAVVGGGPTGVELSAEIHDFIRYDMTKLYPHLMGIPKLTVYDVAEKILGSFDSKLGEYATKKFKRDGTEVKTGTKIKEIQKDKLILADNSEIRVGMVVWATGLGPNEFTKKLHFAKDKSQRLLTDGLLRVFNEKREPFNDIYALGDCATVENYNLPQTAQVAQQKGYYLAKAFNKHSISPNYFPSPFVYRHRGAMAYIGDWNALIDSPTHFKGTGRFAWVIWRSSYLTMTVSWRNKILIPAYWFMTWAFGRDTSRF